EYELTLSAKDLDSKITTRLVEVAKTANMPGFRPGKVPMTVVKARFGDQVKGEVIRTELDNGARDAVEKNALKLASQPRLDIVSYEDGQDLVAKLMVEIMPEITIPDLSAIAVERPTLPANQDEINETINRLAEENRPTQKVEKARKAKMGDVVLIDFTGRIDGVAFEGGSATDHMLELGSNSFIPGFEDGLVGASAGETVDVKVTFPAEYQAEHLAGKEAVFECPVKEIHEKGKASVDDALATKLGFENLEKLREAVAGQLSSQHAMALRQAVKTNVFDELAQHIDFDVPPSLLQAEYDGIARSMSGEEGHDHDHNHDHDHDHDHDHGHSHAADEKLDKDEKAEAHNMALRRVRLGLLLTEIGNQNNITVTEEDTKQAVMQQAYRFPGQEQQVIEYYNSNPDALRELAGPMFEERVMDYILEMAKVTDKEVTVETLYAEAEERAKPLKEAKEKKA
ncbi:MAG: trigger factor, partial [Candidatus Puniceispirillaceae bacterium]